MTHHLHKNRRGRFQTCPNIEQSVVRNDKNLGISMLINFRYLLKVSSILLIFVLNNFAHAEEGISSVDKNKIYFWLNSESAMLQSRGIRFLDKKYDLFDEDEIAEILKRHLHNDNASVRAEVLKTLDVLSYSEDFDLEEHGFLDVELNDVARKLALESERRDSLSGVQYLLRHNKFDSDGIVELINNVNDPSGRGVIIQYIGSKNFDSPSIRDSLLLQLNNSDGAAIAAAQTLSNMNPPEIRALPLMIMLVKSNSLYANDEVLASIENYGDLAALYIKDIQWLIDDMKLNRPGITKNSYKFSNLERIKKSLSLPRIRENDVGKSSGIYKYLSKVFNFSGENNSQFKDPINAQNKNLQMSIWGLVIIVFILFGFYIGWRNKFKK